MFLGFFVAFPSFVRGLLIFFRDLFVFFRVFYDLFVDFWGNRVFFEFFSVFWFCACACFFSGPLHFLCFYASLCVFFWYIFAEFE